MKKILTLGFISVSLLIAGNPIHDKMDNRIKGKSYSGSLDDNTAAQDGLGILPLQHHSGTADMNNELLAQKIFNRIMKTETDKNKTINIKYSLSAGTVGNPEDLAVLNNVGSDIPYIPSSLESCYQVLTKHPNSIDGVYKLKTLGDTTCDMTNGGWTVLTNTNLYNLSRTAKTLYGGASVSVTNTKMDFLMSSSSIIEGAQLKIDLPFNVIGLNYHYLKEVDFWELTSIEMIFTGLSENTEG